MIKCKNECPNEEINYGGCCMVCPDRDACEEVCDKDPMNCGDSVMNEMDETQALATFETSQLAVLNLVKDLVQAKKKLEEQEAELKVKLQEAMEKCGIKKFTSDVLNITYIAETTETRIDSKKLKEKYPEIAAECSNTNPKKAYIKISLKEGKK